MKKLCIILFLALARALPAIAAEASPPAVLTWLGDKMLDARNRISAGDPSLKPALDKVIANADAALAQRSVAVTDKPADAVAASGDPHDYVSVSTYYWPDPTDPKAPWVGHDGERNTAAIAKFDSPRRTTLSDRVQALALGYYFTRNEKYADAAAEQLRRWFLDPKTRMNPNMDYAQSVPNKNKGSRWGIIDANVFPDILNSVALLADSTAWKPADQAALKAWFGQFVQWLTTSDMGRQEKAADNNHGTFYDDILASCALYAGDEALARQVITDFRTLRIAGEIQPDGSTPREQARVGAVTYTCWNLKGMADMVILGHHLGIDLWSYESSDGRSVRTAAHWLGPYVERQKKWTFGQEKFEPTSPMAFYWVISAATGDPYCTHILRSDIIPEANRDHWADSKWMLLMGLPIETVPTSSPAPGN